MTAFEGGIIVLGIQPIVDTQVKNYKLNAIVNLVL